MPCLEYQGDGQNIIRVKVLGWSPCTRRPFRLRPIRLSYQRKARCSLSSRAVTATAPPPNAEAWFELETSWELGVRTRARIRNHMKQGNSQNMLSSHDIMLDISPHSTWEVFPSVHKPVGHADFTQVSAYTLRLVERGGAEHRCCITQFTASATVTVACYSRLAY